MGDERVEEREEERGRERERGGEREWGGKIEMGGERGERDGRKEREIDKREKSLFIPHINYGSLLCGHVGESIDKIQKKAVRTITYSNYIAHSEPLLKSLNLLKVKDLFTLKILKFLFNLYHNKLLPYFNNYILDLEEIETPYYALRPHPLPVPRVSHAYAEAGLVYQLVVMQNKINESDNIISRRIHDQNYSLTSFNQLLIYEMAHNYTYECILVICHTCGHT